MSEELTFEESEKNLHDLKGWLQVEPEEMDEEVELVIPNFLEDKNEPESGAKEEVS
jgi:hypothetical protein